MTKTFAVAVLNAALLVSAAQSVAPASAQSVPEGQSCGGILCDMGVFGHKVDAAPKAPPPAVVAPRAVAAVPVEVEAEPKKASRKHKRVAKAAPVEPPAAPVAEAAAAPARRSAARAKPIASLPTPVGWDAQPSPLTGVTTLAPVTASEPAAPSPVTAAAAEPAPAPVARPSQILDPFSTTPTRAPFRPLY